MKKFYSIVCAAIIVVAVAFNASAQSEQSRQVSGFNVIASSGSFEVIVKIDGTESLKLKGDEADLKEIETVVENGKLQIRYKRDHNSWWGNEHHNKVVVYVTAKSLSGATLAGSGSIKIDGAITGDANLTVSGSGEVVASLNSGSAHLVISGSGSLKLNGTSKESNITISGSGSVNGRELKVDAVTVSIAGSGNVHIDAEKSINAHLVGSGSLYYTGAASERDIRTVGSGRVSHRDE
jgi:hypothetical protein